ncbi:unnamed protein product [Kluyveromyces dobzhanskii CBS 2104]|uniref:WGS project CCBQ000000000 data, contig 00104 n=1 Tax=Kluyveromyces dobzhanskii CBS 2104 TaxID=1427455 RepID=A0A0A8L435_9SACH|nr:unnamed protein product [Kluyveromyces dobzhanskii CBS 2104]
MNVNDKTVTSFDLEPNPFEQSFASTKKGRSLIKAGVGSTSDSTIINVSASVSGASTTTATGTQAGVSRSNPPVLDGKARLLMNTGAAAGAAAGLSGTVKSPGLYSTSNRPPTIQTPPILSPGGSRRLHPLALSPNTGISGSLHGQTSPGAFYLNLTKTGLTPNESNIRSGLTPAIMSNTNNNLHGNPNATSGVNGMHNNPPAIPVALTSSSGLTPGRFTPILNSLLNMPPEQHTFPVVNPTSANNGATAAVGLGSALQPKDEQNTSSSNKSPNSSSYNSNVLSTHSSTSHSIISNNTPQNTLAANIPLDKVKNPDEIMKSVYANRNNNSYTPTNTGEPMLPNTNSTTRSQRKSVVSNFTDSEIDNKETPGSTSSKVSKPASKKRKTSTSTKSKSKTTASDSDVQPETPYDMASDPADTEADRARKRKEFLERNRVAASRFRRRKKEYIKRIEADVSFYESEYNDLTSCLASLTGIVPHNNSMGNPSLINSLKQALITQDLKSALQVCDMLEHTVLKTKYVQRNGVNTRELAHREEDIEDSDS